MIFLIDASVYVFRAYHSALPMHDPDGNPMHAVFGFARFLGDLIERARPKYIAVAFDQRSANSYRGRIYPPYKANRNKAPADLVLQFERCRELCQALGVAMFVDPEYEADDIIGSLSLLMREEGVHSAYITRDKDLAQLMRKGDLFWDYGARDQFGYHDIERHFGVQPERFADYLALTGDEVDNIPGVPGIGHRTAASLMKAFGSLDEIFADLQSVAKLKCRGAGTLAQRLAEHREALYLSRRLTHVVCDMKLNVGIDELLRAPPDLPALSGLYDTLGFGPFLRRQGERLAQLPVG
ncbi:MAG: exodeoxyribonuclease IX [Proteobacteria bacterium]|nr:exodeoxyribonuclease IX [Pseudomonadota bacterium]